MSALLPRRKAGLKYLFIAILFLIIIIFIVRPVCKIVRRFESMSQTQVFEKGTKLNIDSLPLYDLKKGKDSLLSLKGIRLLNFWASWCKPCLDEMKSLEKLQKIYPEIDIDLLSFEDTVSQKKYIS